MPTRRAEFKPAIKKVLAERAGYRCSFPGCRRVTIGPSLDSAEKSINLGKASHIYAAANFGPRANPSMTESQLTSIDNGIWLCAHHSEIIDKDPVTYTAETIKVWKHNAEASVYSALYELQNENQLTDLTLIALTSDLLFFGVWISVDDSGDKWEFEIGQYVQGDLRKMQSLQSDLHKYAVWERYLAIESQGTGRPLKKFSWRLNAQGKYIVACDLGPVVQKHNPHLAGGDIAWDVESKDIAIENGDFKMVSGMDAAIQTLQLLLGSRPGDYAEYSFIGSHFSEYCREYQNNLPVLNRLIKIEIIRLMEVQYAENAVRSELNFINRVLNVQFVELNIDKNIAKLKLELELGNSEQWSGEVTIQVRDSWPPVAWDGYDDLIR